MSSHPIQKVTLTGASGNLGSILLTQLLSTPSLSITILQRPSSTSVYPSNHPRLTITSPPTWTLPDLTTALHGQDAVIASFPLRDLPSHLVLAEAAYASGTVKRFIPADFGSVDSRSSRARELVGLFKKKGEVRELLEKLSENSGGRMTWTSLVNGHFFDWGLTNGFLHFWPFETPKPRAHILGSGEEKSSLATLGQVSKAVVRILTGGEEILERTRNRVVMVQSFCVSQNEVLEVLERVMGKKFEVERVDVEDYIKERKKVADEGGEGAGEAIEDLVFALGVVEGDWTKREEFSMELLGLEEEDLEEVVRRTLDGSQQEGKVLGDKFMI